MKKNSMSLSVLSQYSDGSGNGNNGAASSSSMNNAIFLQQQQHQQQQQQQTVNNYPFSHINFPVKRTSMLPKVSGVVATGTYASNPYVANPTLHNILSKLKQNGGGGGGGGNVGSGHSGNGSMSNGTMLPKLYPNNNAAATGGLNSILETKMISGAPKLYTKYA
jgi:hypothetical protein